MLSDADFSHRLDAALVQVSRGFQSSRVLGSSRSELFTGGSPSEGLACSMASLHLSSSLNFAGEMCDAEKDTETRVTEDTLRCIAKAECEARVGALRQWMDRIVHERRVGEQCLDILKELSACLGSMHEVTRAVQEESNNLSSNASALMVQKTKLEMVQEEMECVIRHFTRIDVLTREVEDAALSATSARFPNMLHEMDEELHFLSLNSQFLSARTYAEKLTGAKQRALKCLKDAIAASLRLAQADTLNSEAYRGLFYRRQHTASNEDTVVDSSDTGIYALLQLVLDIDKRTEAETIINEKLNHINSIFCERLEKSAPLFRMLEMRRNNGLSEEEVNVDEVLSAYCEARVVIIGPFLQNWLETCCSFAATAELMPQLVNNIIFFMMLALTCEKKVYEKVWYREDYAARVFLQLATGFSDEVYHVFRSQLLQVDGLEELSRAIGEVQRANMRQDDVAELGDLMMKMIQDTQERLIFRTSVFLRHYIVRCPPTAELIQEFLDADKKPTDSFIPALNNCVTLLRLLYHSLELSVFSVFAEEAIHFTLVQIQELAKLIGQQRGCEHSVIKGLLCQLRHLLHLRVELSCIHESIKVVEKFIDFSKITQRRLEIVQLSRESKKDVEGEIRACCERIVQVVFSELSEPLYGVALKKKEDIKAAVVVVEQRWATQQRLLDAFILDTSTRDVLLRPVRARIDELLRETALIEPRGDEQSLRVMSLPNAEKTNSEGDFSSRQREQQD